MPTRFDLGVVVLVVVASILEHLFFWPRFHADVAAERPGVRPWAYRCIMIAEGALTLMAIAIWNQQGRPWRVMGFSIPNGWRSGVAIAFVVAAFALLVIQIRSVLRLSVARRIAARPQLGSTVTMLPRTRAEETWFFLLSLTAGFCEELLYRGYLVWFFAPFIGYTAAMALMVVFFGIGHGYQGREGAIRATLFGAVMAALVMLSGSIIPAMIVHALVDIGSGAVGYLLLRDQAGTDAPGPIALGNMRVAS